MSEIIIGRELGAEELGMNSGTGVGFGVSEGVSSNDSSPSQPFGTPPTIELPLAPPEELLEGSNTFTVDGQGGTAVLPKPAIKVEDAPRSQTPVPEVVYVQNGFGGGMVALGVDSEDILASLSLEKLSDGTFAYVKANKRLYYLSDRLLTGVGIKTGSCRWLRVPAGEDSLSFLTEAQVIKMMESTDSYNRTKWVSIGADIDRLRVEYGQATTYLDGRYEQNRSLFEQTATSIRADVVSHKSYVDGRIVDQNSQMLILSNQISTKVSSTEFNPLLGRMVKAESSITQNAADIRLKASQSEVDKLSSRVSSAEILIDGAKADILLKADQSVVDALGTRLTSAEVNIDGAKANILLKAEKSVVDALGMRLTSAEVNIDGAAGKINLLTSRSDGHDTKFAAITIDSASGIQLIGEKVVFSSGNTLLQTMDDKVAPATDAANAAKSIADQAKADALTANTKLASISDDNKLVEVEKSTVIMEYAKIINEQAGIDTQLTAYGVSAEKISYDSAITALTTYLNTLTAPKAWNDISGETNINGVTFRTKFNNVYQARQVALNAVYAKAKSIADSAVSRLNDVDSDNKLTPNEKLALRTDWEKIVVEKAKLEAMADTFNVTTEKATYQSKLTALGTYLNGGAAYTSGVPLLINDSNLSTTTDITGTTLRTRIAEYGDAASSLLRACTDKARVSAGIANAAIADIASDNIITPSEKRTLMLQHASIINEQAQLDGEALSYGITTEKVSYDSAITALTTYLNGLTTPTAWNNLSGNTNVDGATLRGKFADVYTARGTLLGMMYHNARSYSETLDTNTRDAMAQNLGYDSYSAFYTDAITNGKTIIKGGYIHAELIDADAIMTKELVATNMIVKGGNIGDFTVNNKLIGSGYTNGKLNGNQIILDPTNNEIVLAKNGAKRVRLTNNELTALALLQVDGGTTYCSTGTDAPTSYSTVNSILASYNNLGTGVSKTLYVGVSGTTPSINTVSTEVQKKSLNTGFYSWDIPYTITIVHDGSKGESNKYNRITGDNIASVVINLMSNAGVASTINQTVNLKLDTNATGANTYFSSVARFNFAVPSNDSYWIEITSTITPGTRPIRYQKWEHKTFGSSYWKEDYGRTIQYDFGINPGMSIDGSIGITELSNSGFQSVWTPTRYIRIDGNTDNNTFIESWGTWMHNGKPVSFDSETITTYINQDIIASKSFVTQGYYNTAQSDGRYLGISATAADSAKLGGQLPNYYSVSTHNHDSVYLGINATAADSAKLGGIDASQYSKRWYDGWVNNPGYDANTIGASKSGFSYSNNCPNTGCLVHFEAGGYGLQLSSLYHSGGGSIGFRTRNGDANTWNSWYNIYHNGNLNRSDTEFTALKYKLPYGPYINTIGQYLQLRTIGNEIVLGGNATEMHINWREADGGSPAIYKWHKGSGTNWADFWVGGIQSGTYTGSGFTATGWGITTDGDANFRNHTVRGKLTTYELVNNKISVINGNFIVSDNAKISGKVDWWNDGNTIRLNLDVTYNPFRAGDRVKCQSNGKSYALTVGWNNIDEGTSTPFIDVNCVEIGGNSIPTIGDFLVRWNSTDAARKGLLYLCSSDAGSPNYQVLYDGAVKAQFGNLEGRAWLGSTLPANTWGLWAENAYLSGAVNATSGKIGNFTISRNLYAGAEYPNAGAGIGLYSSPTWDYGYKGLLAHVTSRDYIEINASGFLQQVRNGQVISKFDGATGNGFVAKGNIAWDAAGNVTFSDSVKLQWQSGGRNYLRNSGNFKNLDHWGVNGTAPILDTSTTYNGQNTIRFSGDAGIVNSTVIRLKPNTVYTISAMVRSSVDFYRNGDLDGFLHTQNWRDENTGNVHQEINLSNDISVPANTWKKVRKTFRTVDSANLTYLRFYFYACGTGTWNIAYVQCEEGYNATDWTPALEDVDSKLTRIGPDGIYTGTISCDKLTGNNIFGKMITVGPSKDALLLSLGTSGTISSYLSKKDGSNNPIQGALAMELSQGSLSFYDTIKAMHLTKGNITFYDVNSIPLVNLRNTPIGLAECQSSSSVTMGAVAALSSSKSESSDVGYVFTSATNVGSSAYLDKVGSYRVPITFSASGTGSITWNPNDTPTFFNISIYTTILIELEYSSNNSDFSYHSTLYTDQSFRNLMRPDSIGSASSTASISATNKLVSFNITTAGYYRVRITLSSEATGYSDGGNYVSTCSTSLTSNATSSFVATLNSNGTFIGTNGLIVYANAGSEKFVEANTSNSDAVLKVKGGMRLDGCFMNSIALQFLAIGTAGSTPSIVRWQGHESFNIYNFSLSRVSAGKYKLTHYLYDKGLISSTNDYQVVIMAGIYYGSYESKNLNDIVIRTQDDASTNDATEIFVQVILTKGWNT